MKIIFYILITAVILLSTTLFLHKPNNPSNTSKIISTSQTQTVSSGYSMSDVKSHNSESSCWSAINGKVYDLTSWISNHPGGQGAILSLCGTDGSSSFNMQHGGQARPANELSSFYLGDLRQ